MRNYECPKAELIEFDKEAIITSSICECGFWEANNDMDLDGSGCSSISAAANELGYNANTLPWK